MELDNHIIEKIHNLLAMAEHPNSNEHEAALALERAQELLLKHNLTRADIDTKDHATPAGIGVIDKTETDGFAWKSKLANTIALANLCKVVVSPGKHQIHLFGTYDNVRAILEMYNWIVPELESIALREWKRYKSQGGYEQVRTWKAGFFTGATSAIRERIRKPYEAFAQGAGNALVVYNNQALKTSIGKIFPHLGSYRNQTSGGYDGREAGHKAGNGITLTPQRKLSGSTLALNRG